jgi:hypothetical protein
VDERRGRADVGFGKGEYLSDGWGDGDGGRAGSGGANECGDRVEDGSGRYFAFFSHVSRKINE